MADKNKETNSLPGWVGKIVGAFADDSIYVEAMRLGREYRQKQLRKKTEG